MEPWLQSLLDQTDDAELCYGVDSRLAQHYGNSWSAAEMPEEHRTVKLALLAQGIIGNGGFNYLFEGDVPGDPDYGYTAAAFKVIGSTSAAQAFQNALALFPDSEPPRDLTKRLKIYRAGSSKKRAQIESQFWSATKEIEQCLAVYIRDHVKSFAGLTLPLAAEESTATPLAPNNDRSPIQELPHWARVALAVQCARLVFPLFLANWPAATASRKNQVLRAIEEAQDSAVQGTPRPDLEEAVIGAVMAAGAALMGLYGMESEDDEVGPPDGNCAYVASMAAKSAEKAADAARTPPADSAGVAAEAFTFARQAASEDSKLLQKIDQALLKLDRQARNESWTDHTAIPSSVFKSSSKEKGQKKRPWWKLW